MKKIITVLLVLILLATCLSVTCLAAPTVAGSIEEKGAPEIITRKTASGQDASAIIYDKDGNEIGFSATIAPTSMMDLDSLSAEHKENFVAALDELTTTESIFALVPGLTDIVKAYDSSIGEGDLHVNELFDISFTDEMREMLLANEGATVSIRIAVNNSAQTFAVVRDMSGNWYAAERVDGGYSGVAANAASGSFDSLLYFEVDDGAFLSFAASSSSGATMSAGDGYIDVSLSSEGAIALLSPSVDIKGPGLTEESPYTSGVEFADIACVVIAALVLIAVAYVVLRKKSRV